MLRLIRFLFLFLAFFSISAFGNDYTDSLRVAMEQEQDDIRRAHAMALLAIEMVPQNMDSAQVLLEQSSYLADAVGHPIERAAWLNFSGTYNWYRGNLDSAIINYSYTYLIDHPDICRRRGEAAVNLGALYQRKAMNDSARFYYDRAVELFDEVGDEAGKAHVNYSRGIFYFRTNNYELSLRNFLQSISFREEACDTFGLIHNHNVLGNVYRALGIYDKALTHYMDALRLTGYLPSHPTLSTIYNNLASLYITNLKEYEKGLAYAKEGLEIATERGDRGTLFTLYINIGVAYFLQEMFEEAMTWYQKSIDMGTEGVLVYNLAGAQVNYGKLYRKTGQLSRARTAFTEALVRSEAINSHHWAHLANLELFMVDSLEGNYLRAIGHLQESYRNRDSIWQKERSDRISELQIIYETEKREAENRMLSEANQLKEEIIANQRRQVYLTVSASLLIVLLLVSVWISRRKLQKKNRDLEAMNRQITEKQSQITKQNQILDKQNDELTSLNQTKDKFFSIVSHDLRGPFNSLLGFLGILTDNYDQLDEAKKRQMIQNLQKTCKQTYRLTNNLLEWSKVQRKLMVNEPSPTNLYEVVEESIGLLKFNIEHKEHQVSNQVPPDMTCYADQTLLRSVLINFINNAIKFTPRGGKIIVEASPEDSRIKVCVTDNGIGIPESKLANIFELTNDYRQQGTEQEGGTGLGLITAKEFIILMGGKLEVKSKEGKGSSFCFTLPDAPAAH